MGMIKHKERPIIFNTEMVRAILDGRKTMTRRVMKEQPEYFVNRMFGNPRPIDNKLTYLAVTKEGHDIEIKFPYGSIGDRLYVRETWFDTGQGYALYKADMPIVWEDEEPPIIQKAEDYKWKPSIHMPKKYARIWLEITDIRVERIRDIKPDDVYCEGVERKPDINSGIDHTSGERFIGLWNSINEKRGYGWDVNPYVWVVEFKVVDK